MALNYWIIRENGQVAGWYRRIGPFYIAWRGRMGIVVTRDRRRASARAWGDY